MDHNEASLILHDYLSDDLSPERTRELEAHLTSCAECRSGLISMKELRQAVDSHGVALFDEHPSSEELTTLALGEEMDDLSRLAAIRAHLVACPTCLREFQAAREVLGTQAPLQRNFRLKLERHSMRWTIAAGLVIAVATAAMVFSAISSNSLKLERQTLAENLHQTEQVLSALSDELDALRTWSGPFASLLLSSPYRGSNSERQSVRLVDGQPYLPVFVQLEPSSISDEAFNLSAILVRNSDNHIIWKINGPSELFWDQKLQAFSFLLPSSKLDKDDYRFEIHAGKQAQPVYQSEIQLIR